MSNWSKSVNYGGIYASSLHSERQSNNKTKLKRIFQQIAERQLENIKEIASICLEKSKNLSRAKEAAKQFCKQIQTTVQGKLPVVRKIYHSTKNNLKSHVSQKQEVYWPVLIAITLLLFVFASKFASAKISGAPNNLPIESNSKLNVIGFQKKNIEPNALAIQEAGEIADSETEKLKNDIASIVKNTPMAAMIDPISEKDRTVAAFIVGIAMKESKFGVYAPHIGGRDCYNYWGLKAGGKTTAGGYTCFNSPEDAVKGVSKTVEKMVAKGVRTPAQAISWKCGSSCAGHGAANVQKWISDVAINFNKINSKKNS